MCIRDSSDHIQALFQHAAPGLFQVCLANSSPIPREVAARYASEGAEPLQCDVRTCAALGVEVVRRPMAVVEDGYVRHHPDALARELILLHAERSAVSYTHLLLFLTGTEHHIASSR